MFIILFSINILHILVTENVDVMKNILFKTIAVTLIFFGVVSCDKNDDLPIKKDRGYIEVAYDDEQFKFGEKSYTGIVEFHDKNGKYDTIGYFYNSRINHGGIAFDDIKLYGYLNDNGLVDSLRIIYTRVRNDINDQYIFNYNCPEKPLVFSDIQYNPETSWLTANFKGYLFFGIHDNEYIYFKNGKISVPMKGLEIPKNYSH